MPKDTTYEFINAFHQSQANYQEVINMVGLDKAALQARIVALLGHGISTGDLDEIYYLLNTGTVEVTLKELDNFYTSSNTGAALRVSVPPLAWRT